MDYSLRSHYSHNDDNNLISSDKSSAMCVDSAEVKTDCVEFTRNFNKIDSNDNIQVRFESNTKNILSFSVDRLLSRDIDHKLVKEQYLAPSLEESSPITNSQPSFSSILRPTPKYPQIQSALSYHRPMNTVVITSMMAHHAFRSFKPHLHTKPSQTHPSRIMLHQSITAVDTTVTQSGKNNENGNKKKRSWTRAVFSNLQRKVLEVRFNQQKYITKPERKKIAESLRLTDNQVKVWFQNRRMKFRQANAKEKHLLSDKKLNESSSSEDDEIDVEKE